MWTRWRCAWSSLCPFLESTSRCFVLPSRNRGPAIRIEVLRRGPRPTTFGHAHIIHWARPTYGTIHSMHKCAMQPQKEANEPGTRCNTASKKQTLRISPVTASMGLVKPLTGTRNATAADIARLTVITLLVLSGSASDVSTSASTVPALALSLEAAI